MSKVGCFDYPVLHHSLPYCFMFNLVTVIHSISNALMCFFYFSSSLIDPDTIKDKNLDTIKVKNNLNEKGSVVKKIDLVLVNRTKLFKRERTKFR